MLKQSAFVIQFQICAISLALEEYAELESIIFAILRPAVNGRLNTSSARLYLKMPKKALKNIENPELHNEFETTPREVSLFLFFIFIIFRPNTS